MSAPYRSREHPWGFRTSHSNPHYRFEGFDAFLNPEGGQKNISCDPRRSDFDAIVIRDEDAEPRFRTVRRAVVDGRTVVVFAPATGGDAYFERMSDEIHALERPAQGP